MKVLNNLRMMANGSMVGVAWENAEGERFHLWLDTDNGQPVEPYRVRYDTIEGKRVLYRNPAGPAKALRGRTTATSHLDADSKAWAPVLAEALDRAKNEGLFALAQRARIAAEEAEKRARELKVVDMVRKAAAELNNSTSVAVLDLADDIAKSSDETLLALAGALRRAGF